MGKLIFEPTCAARRQRELSNAGPRMSPRIPGWFDMDVNTRKLRHTRNFFDVLKTIRRKNIDVYSLGFLRDLHHGVLMSPPMRYGNSAGHKVINNLYGYPQGPNCSTDIDEVFVIHP